MITHDTPAAIDFLRHWMPNGHWTLSAIEPDTRKIETQTFTDAGAAGQWIDQWQGRRNLYFSVNRPKSSLTKKSGKIDIGLGIGLHVDVDAPAGADLNKVKPELIGKIQNYRKRPTVIIDSGGGAQGFWRLREPAAINGPDSVARFEAYNRGIENDVGGDHCHNVDRIMRLPGTLNIPDAKKKAKGRETCLAQIVWADWERQYDLTDFDPADPAGHAEPSETSERDNSRSAKAMRLGAKLKRGGATFEEMCKALRTDPETAEWYKEQGSSKRQLRRIWNRAEPRDLDGFDLTEDSVALAFAAKFKDQLRYCHHTGSWFEWVGTHWRREETKLAFSWARHTCRALAQEQGANGSAAATMAKAATAAAVERFAQADRAFAVTSAAWDRDPMLLGTPGGTVDLRTGKLRAAEQGDFITKLTAVAPAETSDCPLWLKFLNDVTGKDRGLIRFLQQWAGYCLTGDTREHALAFVYGPGGNGKSVWLNTLARLMGDYAVNAAMDTFTASQNDRHPTDLAMLRGARMVCASETEEGRAWAEVRIKQLTGGDTISARFMRQDFFEFRPQFKLTVIGNHKPVLRNVDDAARRRFNVVPFTRKPAEPDKQLETKLTVEWPAILRWAIEGCIDWLQNGLIQPKSVADATATYFSEQDTLRQWLDECCNTGRTEAATIAALFSSWTNYALANGEKPGTTKWFSQGMLRFGFEAVKHTPGHHGKRGLTGVGLKPVDTTDQWQNAHEANETRY